MARTRAERFEDLALDALDRLRRRWPRELADAAGLAGGHDGLPLGRFEEADRGRPPLVVVYRRPVEARALDELDLAELVHDVVVEQVADLLGRPPEEIDPGYAED